MELIIIFSFMVIYFVVALVIVFFVWRRTTRKLYRFLAVAFVILLPSWDAVLSAIIFYTACPFIPKAEIYETAETEGIYYEGYFRNTVYIVKRWDGSEVSEIPLADRDIGEGYRHVESLVTMRASYKDKAVPVSPPAIYRCTEGPRDSRRPWEIFAQCSPVEEIRSKYEVKSDILKFALIQMDFMKIYDRSTGRLMAEYREISKSPYTGIPYLPFFTWLHWGDFKANDLVTCPDEPKFFEFQYEVLKVKKSPSGA